MELFIVLLVGAMIWVVKTNRDEEKRKREFDSFPSKIDNFKASQQIIGVDKKSGLAIDEYQKKVCIFEQNQKLISSKTYKYKDLLSSEIFEDGSAITSTVRSSQIGGALIGGLALGGVGAIIGGLSGKTKSSGTVKNIELRLGVNDTQKPFHDIKFLMLETKKGSAAYLSANNSVRHWHGVIEVLIKRADMEDRELTSVTPAPLISANTAPQSGNRSIADELKKLADLRDSGVLSVEEFQQQKNKVLAG